MRLNKLPIIILTLFVMAAAAAAQDTTQTGVISGRVTDDGGELLPGVAVTITSPALIKRTQSTVSSATGGFRFIMLPVGEYEVKFEMSGFKTLVKSGVTVALRATTSVNAALQPSALNETVTVTGEQPVIDIKSPTIATNFTLDMLQKLPSARDPWALMELTPGMVMNAQNVGGSQSGSQSSGYAHGTMRSQTQYNLDGITVTDAAMNGASAIYFDFDSFAEVSVETGAHAVDTQSSGVVLNMITKAGGNTFGGGLSLYAEPNWKWIQANNIPNTPAYSGAGFGNPSKYIFDYGGDLGGPIIKDKLWFFGSIRRTEINRFIIGYALDGVPATAYTDLLHWTAKLTGQISNNNRIMGWLNYDNKKEPNRGAGPTRPPITTFYQNSPSWIYHLEDTWTVSPKLLLTFKFGGYNMWWQTAPQPGVDLNAAAVRIYYSSPYEEMYENAYYQYSTYWSDRYSFTAFADYFKDDFLGGDHEIKLGVEYQNTPFHTDRVFPGNHLLYFDYPDHTSSYQVWTFRPIKWSQTNRIYSAFFSDSFSLKKHLTINLGLRFDSTHMDTNRTEVENNIWVDYYDATYGEGVPSPNVSPARKNVVAWNVLYPRIGLTYDLFNDASTVFKLNLSRYSYQVSYDPAFQIIDTSYWEVDYRWFDDNEDGQATTDELGSIQYINIASKYNIDPELKAPYIDEAIVGVERKITNDVGLSVNFMYRQNKNQFFEYNLAWNPVTSFTPIEAQDPGPDGTTGTPDDGGLITVYDISEDLVDQIDYFITTRAGYKESYRGVELTLRKKFSHKWLGQASVTYGKSNVRLPITAVNDPNNRVFNDDVVAWNDCPWIVKIMGSYELPFGITFGGFFNYRSGMPAQRFFRYSGLNQGRIEVAAEKFGDSRYPNMAILDLRLSKVITTNKFGTFEIIADVFNSFNSHTILEWNERSGSSYFHKVEVLLAPRILRLGFKWRF